MNQSLDALLKNAIETEKDSEKKELMAMAYAGLVYSQYVSSLDPELHKKACSFLQDMHGLKCVSFEDTESPYKAQKETP